MTKLNGAAHAAALNDALRDWHVANDRLATILAGEANPVNPMTPIESKGSNADIGNSLNWPKSIDASGFEQGLHIARTLVVRRDTARVYVAGCQGLRSLSKELRLPLFKIGSTSVDLLQRLAELGADRYAAAYRVGETVLVDPDFDRWKLMTMDFAMPRAVESPVWIEPRGLRVTLPKSLSGVQFEARLREALAPISLAHWLTTEDADPHFVRHGISKARAERSTPYGYGDSTRLSRADELYIFRHRIDMPRLCRLCELIAQDAAQS